MSTVADNHPLDLASARLTVAKPDERVDRQGDLTDSQRVEQALSHFVADVDFTTATYMESCIHCGLCAEVCPFYAQTGDPKYTPVWKLEPFKQAYKREVGPFSFFFKLFNLKHKVTVDELQDWQHLLYDACTLCGRCSLVCPMGIDITDLIGTARHGMFQAGLVPHELWAMAQRAEVEGSPLGATPAVFKACVQDMQAEYAVDIPLDLEQADVLLTVSAVELQKYPRAIADMARILNHMGCSWTFRSDGYEATNFGMLSGNSDWQADMSSKLIDAALACKAKTLVVPECGHAFTALRWKAANLYGKSLPFRILHITELMAEGVENGRLRVTPVNRTMTFHDPCQLSRRGGATAAPRSVLKALGVELREMPGGGDVSWCCGGGGGVISIHRADPLRYKAFQLKMAQVEASGAKEVVTSCANCRQNFADCSEHFHWGKQAGSLVELVAENLAPSPDNGPSE